MHIPNLRRLCHTFPMTESLVPVVCDGITSIICKARIHEIAWYQSPCASFTGIAVDDHHILRACYKWILIIKNYLYIKNLIIILTIKKSMHELASLKKYMQSGWMMILPIEGLHPVLKSSRIVRPSRHIENSVVGSMSFSKEVSNLLGTAIRI